MKLLRKLLCLIGLHSGVFKQRFYPSIAARIVTEYEATLTCRHCDKRIKHVHWVWNGEEMADVK